MADPVTQAYDMTRAVQDEALKNAQRWSHWVESFVANPADPPMGMTPKDVVWKRGKIQLYRYQAQTAQRRCALKPRGDRRVIGSLQDELEQVECLRRHLAHEHSVESAAGADDDSAPREG